MVRQTQNEKHIKAMDSIIADSGTANFRFLYEDPAESWFREVGHIQEAEMTTETPIATTESPIATKENLTEKNQGGVDTEDSTPKEPEGSIETPHVTTPFVTKDKNISSILNPKGSLIIIQLLFVYLSALRRIGL